MRDWHRPRINALLEAGVDLLGLETLPSRVEAEMLLELLRSEYPGTKAWLTFSVRVRMKMLRLVQKTATSVVETFSKMVNQHRLAKTSKKQQDTATI